MSSNVKHTYHEEELGKRGSNLRLSDAVVITYTSPVITAIAAALLLGEAWGKLDALGSLLCMLGVMLISALAALPSAPACADGQGPRPSTT